MRTIALLSILVILAGVVGCGEELQMDYGQPAAQFLEEDVVAMGKEYVGKKITVKGTVTKVEVSDAESAWIHLNEGVRCNLGKFKAMAQNSKVGDTVYVDGFLKHCEKGDVLIEPGMLRVSSAPFSPVQ
ncbi:MAG: hypothetical protein H0T51_07490 [Pirellulales bacterium]|nr:hypothetical protein [Pirellulales bacterium]